MRPRTVYHHTGRELSDHGVARGKGKGTYTMQNARAAASPQLTNLPCSRIANTKHHRDQIFFPAAQLQVKDQRPLLVTSGTVYALETACLVRSWSWLRRAWLQVEPLDGPWRRVKALSPFSAPLFSCSQLPVPIQAPAPVTEDQQISVPILDFSQATDRLRADPSSVSKAVCLQCWIPPEKK